MPQPILFPLIGGTGTPNSGVGPLVGRAPLPVTTPAPGARVTKLTAYAVLNSAPEEAAVGVAKLTAYAVLNLFPLLPQIKKPILFLLADPRRAGGGLGIGPLLAWPPSASPVTPTSVAEAAAASDSYSQTLTWSASLTEPTSATDAISATFGWTVSVTEAGSAVDAYSQTLTWSASLTEPNSATDAWSKTYTGGGGSPAEVTKLTAYAVLSAAPADAAASVTKLTAYLILSAALTDAAAGVTKLTAYATLNAAPADAAVSVTKLTSYVVIPNIDIRDGFDPLFPPNLSFGATGGCGWKTNVVVTSSGEEYRSAGWSLSLGRWIVSHKLRTAQQMTELASLFRSCQGQKGVFRFKDWTDFTVGSGEGVIVLFEGMDVLAKKYTILDVFGTTYVALRPIFRPSRYSVVFNEPNIGLNYSNGVVYNANRLTTTWTGEFEVPARFASDFSDIAFKTPTGLGWDNIVIQEDRISLAGV